MVVFPPAKINLGLYITAKRQDGYHDLETIFAQIPLFDVLEIITHQEAGATGVTFTTTGLPIPGDFSNNLCIKAYHLLKADFPNLPPIRIHLHKVIPMGAGMGGGSADGAYTLTALNTKYNLQLSREQLLPYALQLGSDCPLFLYNQPCLGQGRGEILTPIQWNQAPLTLVVVNPGIHITTKTAFSQIKPAPVPSNWHQIIHQPIENWAANLCNQFEAPMAHLHPEIKHIINDMYRKGAVYASMTGSGSTCYALFKQTKSIETVLDKAFGHYPFYKVLPFSF